MSKKIVIYLISTLLFITGCNKNNEISESLDTKQDNISSSSEEVSLLEPLSEDGEVIKNAAVPKSEGEGIDVITSVQADKNIPAATSEHDVAVFFRAIYDNNTAKISDFLHDGFDINAMNKNGENAVNAAIASGSYYVLQFLIDNGANLNSTSDTGIPPLSQAILEYNKQAVDMLLNSKKVDMYYVWGDIWTGSPLYIACSKANVYALEKMVENDADLNYDFSEYNAVPLIHYALNYKQYIKQEEYRELIAFLILNKINVNIKNNKGHTPLMTALKNGDIDGFNALIAGGADITIKDDDGKTALFYAEHLKGSSMLPDNEYNKIIHLLSMDNGTK